MTDEMRAASDERLRIMRAAWEAKPEPKPPWRQWLAENWR